MPLRFLIPSRAPGSAPARAVAALGLAAMLGGCGHKGDPRPPLSRTPQPVTGFRLAQRGDQLEVRWVTPRASTAGVPLPVMEVELQRLDGQGDFEKRALREVKEAGPGEAFAERSPLPPVGTVVRMAALARARGDESTRTPVVSLTVRPAPPVPTGLVATPAGGGVELSWTAPPGWPPPPPSPAPSPSPAASPSPGAVAPSSPAPAPSPEPPAPSPATLPGPAAEVEAGSPEPEATPEAEASPGAAASPGPGRRRGGAGKVKPAAVPPEAQKPGLPAPTAGFNVYRHPPGSADEKLVNPQPLQLPTHRDPGVSVGESYCYTVRSVGSTEPLVESAASDEACTAFRDVAPPPSPGGLLALARGELIELSWSPPADEDTATIVILRALPGEELARVGEVPRTQTTWQDREVPSGVSVRYAIVARDAAGNESAPSRAVGAERP